MIVDPTPQDYGDLLAAVDAPGVSIHFLLSSNEALRFAKRHPAGLWVINTRLTDISGFDLAQMLRSVRPSALVFMIGNEYRLDDEMQALTLGLAKYLCKPLEPSWILPHSQDFCVPLPLDRSSPPKLCVVGMSESNSAQDLPESVSVAAADTEDSGDQFIVPFNPDFRRGPGFRRKPAA